MAHAKWDPELYARFSLERLRPGFELMERMGPLPDRGAIVDLGCGAGEHLVALADRHRGRDAIGVDLSPDMLAKARAANPNLRWVEAELTAWSPDAPLALLFSNAALQWVGDHEALIPRLFSFLAPRGWLALQMPANLESAAHEIARELCVERGWREAAASMFRVGWVLQAPAYYDLLAAIGAEGIDIWETTYWHRLGASGVTEWVKGTALRPILSALSEADGAAFLAEYDARVRRAYPPQSDGVTLYPQNRIFILARRA